LPKPSIPQESNTLGPLETQINTLSGLVEKGRARSRFPARFEAEFVNHRLNQVLNQDLRIIAAGLIVFLVFGWADFYFGGSRSAFMVSARMLLTGGLFIALFFIPRSRLRHQGYPLLVVGIYTCMLLLCWNITQIKVPLAYFYHSGMIPMQVFALLALRSNYRAMLACSFLMLFTYVIFVVMLPPVDSPDEIDRMAYAILPFYLLFWLILIAMGGYLSFIIESGSRTDFVKNRLLALEAERLQYLGRKLQQLSVTDSLTGLFNRRYVEERLTDEWRRCSRSQEPLSVLMLDVDSFKLYNDFYGHQQGDVCLKSVATRMADFCRRPGDVCARFGGEEFLILLPETHKDKACELAQDICNAVAAMALPHSQSEHGVVTVSMGVATYVPDPATGYESLLREADVALYRAKDRGRNQVCCEGAGVQI